MLLLSARRMWRLNDLFGVIPAHAAERLRCIALANLEMVSEGARQLLEINRRVLNSFLVLPADLSAIELEFGTVAFPQL